MRCKPLFSLLKTLLTPSPKRFNPTESSTTDLSKKTKTKYAPPDSTFGLGEVSTSRWKTLDSRRLGLDLSMIPESSWSVMETLRRKGFEVYLVGGCVRDLLLNRRPKDFDVITTAALKQVQQHFRGSVIVGQRFPICLIHSKGTVIEVSSFQTMPEHTIDRERFVDSQMPRSCSKSDLVIWKDTMRRDFTINSLFFNPFANKIYDYANGLVDLRSLKLRTLIPAHLSFTEDSARILRGVRVAARLGLSLSKETEIAMRELSLSILDISKFRLMMELNYMLSYGAAKPSLDLLHRFGMLENLLPFHAAYLTHHASKYGQSDTMLMKLFFSLDRLVSCDQPSTSVLWVSLLAFHLALVEKPQHPLVVLTLASLLYYGKWTDAVHFARKHVQTSIHYEPEILEAGDVISDDELAEKVIQLLSLIKDSSSVLSDVDSLHERMSSFPDFRYHGLVFISRLTTKNAVSFFKGAEGYINSNKKQRRENFRINYNLLREKNKRETKFVIGRIIMDTMVGDVKKQTMSSSSNPQLQEVTAEKQKLNVELRTHLKHKSINKSLADGVEGSEEIPQIMRGSVMKTDLSEEATEYRMEMAGKENVGSSQNYIAKTLEKFSSRQLTIGKDVFEREEKDCQQVWESKNEKFVEIKEEMERLRFLASQEEKLQKPVNHHLHPSNVSEQQVGRCTSHKSKEKRTQRPLSDLFK